MKRRITAPRASLAPSPYPKQTEASGHRQAECGQRKWKHLRKISCSPDWPQKQRVFCVTVFSFTLETNSARVPSPPEVSYSPQWFGSGIKDRGSSSVPYCHPSAHFSYHSCTPNQLAQLFPLCGEGWVFRAALRGCAQPRLLLGMALPVHLN